MNAELTPDYARTADINLFDLATGVSPGDHVRVETDDDRTFEGKLVEAEVVLADRGRSFIEQNGLRLTFERDDGHRMKVSQFMSGVSIRTGRDCPHTAGHETFVDLNNSPDVADVSIEQADADDEDESEDGLGEPAAHGADEFADEEPRDTCGACGGETVHVDTRTVNGWVNEASAYDSFNYECLECGATGSRNESGERVGCVAAPAEPSAD